MSIFGEALYHLNPLGANCSESPPVVQMPEEIGYCQSRYMHFNNSSQIFIIRKTKN